MEGNLTNPLSEIYYLFIFFALLLGPHLRHMDVPRLGVISELQLLAYTTATAMQDLHLRPTPQIMATLDPQPTEQGHGLNLHPHGH